MWICQLHGIHLLAEAGKSPVPSIADSSQMLKTFGPKLDPKEIRRIEARGESCEREPSFRRMITAAEAGNAAGFNSSFEELMRNALAPWLPLVPHLDLSFAGVMQARRATRVAIVALALHRSHPLTLIARSWRGDKGAVLELVSIDRLFLHDGSTASVIRTAALKHDQPFMTSLARAQRVEPRLRRRELIRIYLNVLFVLEEVGQAMPRIDELQRLLDPTGTIYEGPYAFERDIQRMRERFSKMFVDADSEPPTLLDFYRESFLGTRSSQHPKPRS